MSSPIYGKLPDDLGLIELKPREMMFWMYCPISLPGMPAYVLPDNLKPFAEIVSAVKADDPYLFRDRYAYLTAKTLWVSGEYIGNRPGWHSDGFGTDDLNFIWSDRAPTEFIEAFVQLSQDCDTSMEQMEALGNNEAEWGNLITYPDRHLLKLDERVIHRSPVSFYAGMRTFVKVSLSKERYDLMGNSLNHSLPESYWPMVERREQRNHPASVQNG